MNKNLYIAAVALVISSCASRKSGSLNIPKDGLGNSRKTPVEYLDDNTYHITEQATDKTYGYQMEHAVKVGGVADQNGPKNERRYLNGLLGPNGETLEYFRAGSCCAFKTPNGMIGGMGLLDRYRVYWKGGKDTLDIYINMYDEGDLKIPVGLTARKK